MAPVVPSSCLDVLTDRSSRAAGRARGAGRPLRRRRVPESAVALARSSAVALPIPMRMSAATMLRTIWRRKASPMTSIVSRWPCLRRRITWMVRTAPRPGVARRPRSHADRPAGWQRPAWPRRRGVPRVRRHDARAAGCAVLSRWSSGTPVRIAARRGSKSAATRRRGPIATSRGSNAPSAGPSCCLGMSPGQVNAITCPVACTPASVRPAAETRMRDPH